MIVSERFLLQFDTVDYHSFPFILYFTNLLQFSNVCSSPIDHKSDANNVKG